MKVDFESAIPQLFMDDMLVEVEDPAGLVPPKAIIQEEDDWQVVVKWKISGISHFFMAGDWRIDVYYEGLGGANDGKLNATTLKEPVVPGKTDYYEKTIDVNVANANKLPPGVYRLITTIGFENTATPPDVLEVQAFCEGPLVSIYEHL